MLKINFVDFWPNFNKTDNYFFHLLDSKYDVVIDEGDPDLLFFSVDYTKRRERDRYKNHRCKKIFFTGENVPANFDIDSVEYPRYSIGKCDIAFTFEQIPDERNFRFPLWAFYTDWFNVGYREDRDPAYLVPLDHLTSTDNSSRVAAYRMRHSGFCNFVYSNESGERVKILEGIQEYKPVTCAGRLKNNTGILIRGRGDQIYKIDFISMFKFTIAAENSKGNGYVTEKILHPLSVGSIPIYWGSDMVTDDFNPDSFINANHLSVPEILEELILLDTNEDMYWEMVDTNKVNQSALDKLNPEVVLSFLEKMI